MKRLLLACVIVLISLNAGGEEWKLVWSDEFDKPGLPDPAKWDYETGFVRNNEVQFYTRGREENARVEGGNLVIEARKEQWRNPDYVAPGQGVAGNRGASGGRGAFRRTKEYAEYTSASLVTLGKASWTHGRIEVRAKLPPGRGTWPAIWTLGTNFRGIASPAPARGERGERSLVGWPACGEIDIMEHVGMNAGVIHGTVHTRKYNHGQNTHKGETIAIADATTAFHVYAVEWFPTHLDFFVDDRKYFTFKNEGTGLDAWPFDEPQFLLLNLAIGGQWGGRQGIDEAAFPQRYYVDYVRVYQQASQGTAK